MIVAVKQDRQSKDFIADLLKYLCTLPIIPTLCISIHTATHASGLAIVPSKLKVVKIEFIRDVQIDT